MDRNAFDGLTKLLASSPSRRAALGALLGTGLAGAIGAAEAAKKNRKKRRYGKKGKGTAQVSAQAADCLSPGPSSNMNNCPFQGSDFSGQDLSGSSMVGTNFNNAELVGTKLHSSNMKNASFRGADLECADLSSSTLRNADFRGFNPANGGRVTNLTGADLSSSGGCGAILTNQFTVICGTIWCDGSVRNDSCPSGPPAGLCDVTVCDDPITPTSCDCVSRAVDGVQICRDTTLGGFGLPCSAANPACPGDQVCIIVPCTGTAFCVEPCPSADPCTCPSGVAVCGENAKCGETAAAARRRAGGSPFKP